MAGILWTTRSLILVVLLVLHAAHGTLHTVLQLRGGLVPQAKEGNVDYYEQFHLDYGTRDNKRIAGALRGFITTGKLASLPESDPFFKWLNAHLEKGPEPISGRLKPFYAADFGEKKDLRPGENPKVMIVQRRLHYDKNGVITAPLSGEVDVEVREIWQPWLKPRCNFVARYIVPNRVNIVRIMEARGQFLSELEVDDDDSGRSRAAWTKMTFRPTLAQRLGGKRDIVVRRLLDASKLTMGSNLKLGKTTNAAVGKQFHAGETVKGGQGSTQGGKQWASLIGNVPKMGKGKREAAAESTGGGSADKGKA